MRTYAFWTTATTLTLATLIGCSGDTGTSQGQEVQQYSGPLAGNGLNNDQGTTNSDMNAGASATNSSQSTNSNQNSANEQADGTNGTGNSADSSADTTSANDAATANEQPNQNSMLDSNEMGANDNSGDSAADDADSNSEFDNSDEQDQTDEPITDNGQPPADNTQPIDPPEPDPIVLEVEFSELYQNIFVGSCSGGRCHGATAPRAPFATDDVELAYDVIVANAPFILERLQGIGSIMPRGCGNGLDNGSCLSQDQFDDFKAWVDADTPR